jgi:hypothetical protein
VPAVVVLGVMGVNDVVYGIGDPSGVSEEHVGLVPLDHCQVAAFDPE